MEEGAPAATGDELTIDELAARVGMTVRNIRAHQARGLLPAPTIRGRSGYYNSGHVRRLEQIQAMQDEGLNLAAIAKVLRDGRLTEVTAGAFQGGEPAWFDPADLLARLGGGSVGVPDPTIVSRAVELGLITVDGDRIRMDVPGLLAVAEEFLALGVPLQAQVDALAEVQEATAQVAQTYLRLADDHLITRVAVDAQGDIEAIRASVERLRELARIALDASFDRAMSAALRAYFEPFEEAAQAADPDREPASG